MHSARLMNGSIVAAKNYSLEEHGVSLFCMDAICNAPVHFVRESSKSSFFKTSGKGDSVHKEGCAFASKLSFENTVSKVSIFQQELRSSGGDEFVIRLNTNKIDPDYVPRNIEREAKEKEVDPTQIKVKQETNDPPQTLSSLSSLKKLFTTVDADLLAGIVVSVQGYKLPISQLISDYRSIHQRLWSGTALNIPYFVHGTIQKIVRLPKVWYFNLHDGQDFYFTLVVFEKYFNHFTLTDEELMERPVLVMGKLRKNTFNQTKPSTEMVIKSNKYIEFLD